MQNAAEFFLVVSLMLATLLLAIDLGSFISVSFLVVLASLMPVFRALNFEFNESNQSFSAHVAVPVLVFPSKC